MKQVERVDPFSFRGASSVGILLIHGFTGSPFNVRYLGGKLAEAGYNVEGPCLAGHGSTWRDLQGATRRDWIHDAEEALARLRERSSVVFAGGLSMGGALCLHLAQHHPDLAGIVLVNHAVCLNPGWLGALVPLARVFISSVKGGIRDVKDPEAREEAFERIPLAEFHELFLLMREVRSRLAEVRQPTLIFKSRDDHVVPIKSATLTYDRISSTKKELVWLENSYHVAIQDYDRDIIAAKTLEFVSEISREKTDGTE
jgi:carboxylesterase